MVTHSIRYIEWGGSMIVDNGRRILIADDDLLIRTVISKMLIKMGMGADLACNGKEALDAMIRWPYDVVLMDIQMPEMDGIEATRIIREHWHSGPRIVIISDCDPSIYEKTCYDAGANSFLSKPVNMDDLKAAVEG
ncbi:MAG TPA: response regulator [Methanothrix sp.]|nr:response regulator [Methanothrix sp.]HQE87128.1 response regulator [Methanothrix sp.]HRT16591.1 response regulator [Methanothrix sp.]